VDEAAVGVVLAEAPLQGIGAVGAAQHAVQVDVVRAQRARGALDHAAGAIVAASLHQGAVAHYGAQAVEVVVAVLLHDVAGHGRPLAVVLHDAHACVLVAGAGADLVVRVA